MPFKKGADPNRFDLSKHHSERRSRNPSTEGAEVVRMDPAIVSRIESIKNPNAFASTGGWGTSSDVWGTFKSVSSATQDRWTHEPQVTGKAEPW